jgi:hypothetical protein
MNYAELIRDWNPLDGVPMPEFVPDEWDGPHAGKRLADALRTLSRLTVAGRVAGFGSAWPAYRYEWRDEVAQAGSDEEQQQQEAAAKNWTKIVPTSEEIGRMEIAIAWPARYLDEIPQLLRVVGAVAHARARYLDIGQAARRLHIPQRLVRRWYSEGTDMIAAGLIRDNIAVF